MKIKKGDMRWLALFRDGSSIDQCKEASEQIAFQKLVDYIYGTPEDPKRHYLLWFMITDGEHQFIVSFDFDGDAYMTTPDGNLFMTEFKIRSAELLYAMKKDVITGSKVYHLGFGGINTCGYQDGKAIVINDDGEYTLASELPRECAIIEL